MKSFRILTTMFLLAVVCIPGTVAAGQRPEAFSLSPLVGYHIFNGDQNTDDSEVYGLAVGYNVNKRWAIELDTRFTPTQTDLPNSSNVPNEDVDVWTIGLNALYHFNPDGNFVPYVSAGFGGMVFDVDEFKDDEDFMMNWGVGAKYFISDNWAFRLDARHIIDFHSDRSWDHNNNDTTDHNFMAMAGLYWQFGGISPPVPQPLDSDNDGIPDARDKCPDTPFGTLVDAVGCPPTEKAPAEIPTPVDGDDDGDGIPNSRDKCPDTPKGVIVDEFGCPVKYTLYVEFDFDKSEIRPEYHSQLKEAADFINKHEGVKFLLAGHTDSLGSDAYNIELSKRRAAAVKKYLAEEFGIAAQLLYPRGYGERQPIATNATEEGRQKNRRVEVICCMIIPAE